MTPSDIAAIARRQLTDYDAHQPGQVFEDDSFRLTVDEAYAVQMQTARMRVARGEAIAGYKIGCVSEAVQRQLNLDRAVFGHLFATELYRSGVVLKPDGFEGLAIEGEFAVRIAEDISDVASLLERPERSIASVFVVIELHNNVFRRPERTSQELIANNALHAGTILPAMEGTLRNPAELVSERLAVFRNRQLLGTAAGGSIPGGPLLSMVRIAKHVARMGGALKRGQILLTGSPLPLYPAGPGDQFVVRSQRAGEVRVNISSGLTPD